MSQEKQEFFTIHPVRVSKIKKIYPMVTWKPEGRNSMTQYIIEVEFENNDYVKVFTPDLAQTQMYSEKQNYVYQIETVTTIEDDKSVKTRNRFVFIKHLLPLGIESMLDWVKETHKYIIESARLSAGSFTDLDGFNEQAFKDRAGIIFDWMQSTLKALDFGTKEGKEFDEYVKENIN